MALETWLTRVKSAIRSSMTQETSSVIWLTRVKSAIRSSMTQETSSVILTKRSSTVGILAFEIASLMSKLVHLWRSLSDSQISRLRHETIALEGVRKVVSDDDGLLLGLAFAELAEALRLVAASTSHLSKQCADQELRRFDQRFKSYADSGADPSRWAMSAKEMDSRVKKMDRLIAATAALYKEMDELADSEHGLKKMIVQSKPNKMTAVADVQQKIFWKRQEVKYLRQSSLWGSTFDGAISLLSRSIFTILARIKHVFGIDTTTAIPRSPSVSAAVHPDSPLKVGSLSSSSPRCDLFELSSSMITPPESTLGAAALATQYANVHACDDEDEFERRERWAAMRGTICTRWLRRV
ncbi:uncharacterized protein A4U43_C04F11240 [Asparagus officinalis]|uniref:DUF3475 domain-containing protein n=1 Tax=Asparagus officinalis TaxID=4686 RepID=A0A5P1F5D3_ASPOF|nr:uncharacterized protein A4U43_C04F11240 [Asparagus officinalis]